MEVSHPYYKLPHARPWSWAVLACSALMVIPLIPGFDRWLLSSRAPLGLKVREEAGQLRISWQVSAVSQRARLEIFDGAEHTSIFVSGKLASATYAPRTGVVEVRLITLEDGSASRSETVHYVRHVPARPLVQAPMEAPPEPEHRLTGPPRSRVRRPVPRQQPEDVVPREERDPRVAYFWR